MEWIVAVVALVIGFVLARRGYLHPYDYVVAAALAVLLAVTVLPYIPPDRQVRVFTGLGAPELAWSRDAFFRAHGMKIVIASLLAAVGGCLEAWIRARRGGWDHEYEDGV